MSELAVATKTKVVDTKLKTQNSTLESDNITSIGLLERSASCACGGGCPSCQTKSNGIKISRPNDIAEIEADQIADKVMQMPARDPVQISPNISGDSEKIHAKCDDFEEEQIEEDIETLQRKKAFAADDPPTDNIGTSVKNAVNSSSHALDAETRHFFEPRFGSDLGHVRIHTNTDAAKSSKAINARAYTLGNDIVFGSGEYKPSQESGRRLLAHELAHVAQRHSVNGQLHRTVTPAPTTFRTYAQLRAMKVPAFLAYIEQQADWFSNPAMTDDQRQRIRNILLFINEDVAAYFTYVGIWYFDLLINDVSAVVSAENSHALQAYASSASGRHMPFPVSNAPVAVTTAIEIGKDIVKLQQSFDDYILHDSLNETQFLRLRNRTGYVDDVVRYHDTAQQQPTFQAEDGADFQSFIIHNQATSRNALFYESTPLLNKIRNFHRFQKTALDRLVTNYADRSHTKPVTLILHTALDHNGAFHHDPNLTAVIRNNNMLTLMIEGFELMSEYQALMNTLAADYGQQHGVHFLIDQVMFAGHGNAQQMQLAGSIHEDAAHPGHIEEIDDGLNVASGHEAATRSLLQDVLNFMANPANGTSGMSPHNRVVFNACLTGSNSVATAVNAGDPAVASTEIQTFIAANPSLSTFLHNIADPSLGSIGSRASFGQVSLINSANELDIMSADDPAMTAAAAITYAENGAEATGTLRAALEAWATDRPATIAAMQRRAALAATSWDAKLIKKAYQIILDPVNGYQNNGEGFRLVALSVERITEMQYESSALVSSGNFSFFQGMTSDGNSADAANLLGTLITTAEWSNSATKLALLQVWMTLDSAKQADFMARIATHNCNFSVRFVDIGFLAGQSLISTLLASAASDQSKFRLALIGVLGNNNDTDARTYLLSLLVGAAHFPATLNITTALGGATSEAAILIKIGATSAPGAAAQVANIQQGSSGTNALFVERLNASGIVSNPYDADIYSVPDDTTPVLTTLSYNAPVAIIGRTTDWYAIQFSSGASTLPVAAFVSRFSVDLVR